MDTKRNDRERELFEASLKLPPEERSGYLRKSCGEDRELEERVHRLLAAHARAGDDTGHIERDPDRVHDEPKQIGPYRILGRIGEGGMGVVYAAEQRSPVRRKVALKVIKLGMDTREVIGRFELERQAMALMDHPGIARILDAGATDTGRPYFVMEYVQGEPITDYCDRHRLDTRKRLELFMQVCDGVQHAHHKGVIHRDIKPSNVLVAIQDDTPFPKIIDFGVAKATQYRLTEQTVYTKMGMLIGTPEYMSPEQAEMTTLDIDTRTDVYSLGVLLYELLVGALPFDPRELRQAHFDEIRRKIREDEPSKPSERVASRESAGKHGINPASLARRLRGDLDWITMKSLEKNRTRRYGSPNELAADIGRHLSNEPVLAGRPSSIYRAGKFLRRHRVAVTVTIAIFLLLVGVAGRERAQANRIAREAATAEQVSEFLTGLFTISDPSEARGNSITAREILDRGTEEIEETLADQPEVQARLLQTMGVVYRKLGLYPQAEPLLERAVELRREWLGKDHADTLGSMNSLAILYADQGRYDEAEPLYSEVLEARVRALGGDDADTLSSMNNLAILHWNQGRYDEAEALYLESLEARKRVLGDDHRDTLSSKHNLAILYADQGRYDEAEALNLEMIETRKRVLGDDHPSTLQAMNNLTTVYYRQNRHDEAGALYLETLEIQKRVLGDDHPDTLATTNNLAVLYLEQGRYDEAEPLWLEILETLKQTFGDEHPNTLGIMNNLADLYHRQGRFDESEPLYLEILETQKRVLPEDHPFTLSSMSGLADLYNDQSRYDEAERLYLEALEARKRVLGDDHPSTRKTRNGLAGMYDKQGRTDEAEALRAASSASDD